MASEKFDQGKTLSISKSYKQGKGVARQAMQRTGIDPEGGATGLSRVVFLVELSYLTGFEGMGVCCCCLSSFFARAFCCF